jgi:hypothetical protein
MTFTEFYTVEQMILKALCSRSGGSGGALAVREDHSGSGGSLGGGSGKGCR